LLGKKPGIKADFVDYPILLLFLEPLAGVCLALNMIVENLLIILLFLAMAEQSRDEYLPWPHLLLRTLSRLEVNPLIIALMAGVAVSLSGIGLAVIFIKTVNLLALSSSALTLFFIGGKLVTTVSSFFSLSLLLWGLGHLL
jgi:malonate transporter